MRKRDNWYECLNCGEMHHVLGFCPLTVERCDCCDKPKVECIRHKHNIWRSIADDIVLLTPKPPVRHIVDWDEELITLVREYDEG